MLTRGWCHAPKTCSAFFIFALIWLPVWLYGQKSVVVSWNANGEADLAGYRIYYGTRSGQYAEVVDVGNVTSHRLQGLQTGETYYFVVTAYDTAGNESPPSREVSVRLMEKDTTPPLLVDVRAVASNALLVKFSERVHPDDAVNAANYSIVGGPPVLEAGLQPDSASVQLRTEDHAPGRVYVLRVQNIRDLANPPNWIPAETRWSYVYQPPDGAAPADTLPPRILNVQVLDENHVEIVFDEKVGLLSAQNPANYALTGGMQIGKVELEANERAVRMTTSLHQDGTTYMLTVRNIADTAEPPNIMLHPVQWSYTYHAEDHEPPRIVDGSLEDPTHLWILFSEKVLPSTAQQPQNYQISDGVTVNSATLLPGEREVLLVTTPHQYNHQYTLKVSGVRDQSPFQNLMQPESSFSYLLAGAEESPTPDPFQGDGLQAVTDVLPRRYQLTRAVVGEPMYIDAPYQLISVPPQLSGLACIKTALADRNQSSARFLQFHLLQPARVFIGYDAQATVRPNWLTANFEPTRHRLSISGPIGELEVWQARLAAGPVVLGGNAAFESGEAQAMYVVLIEPLAEEAEATNAPQDFVLYQNYPNPFNPRTEISFYLRRKALVELKVYDARGRLVRRLAAGMMPPGLHRLDWNATDDSGRGVPSGTYFYVLEIKEQVQNNGFLFTPTIMRRRRAMTHIR